MGGELIPDRQNRHSEVNRTVKGRAVWGSSDSSLLLFLLRAVEPYVHRDPTVVVRQSMRAGPGKLKELVFSSGKARLVKGF